MSASDDNITTTTTTVATAGSNDRKRERDESSDEQEDEVKRQRRDLPSLEEVRSKAKAMFKEKEERVAALRERLAELEKEKAAVKKIIKGERFSHEEQILHILANWEYGDTPLILSERFTTGAVFDEYDHDDDIMAFEHLFESGFISATFRISGKVDGYKRSDSVFTSVSEEITAVEGHADTYSVDFFDGADTHYILYTKDLDENFLEVLTGFELIEVSSGIVSNINWDIDRHYPSDGTVTGNTETDLVYLKRRK